MLGDVYKRQILNYTKRDIILVMKRGERLRNRRLELGLTMRQAAKMLGISISGVQNLEKDEVMPNLRLGMTISNVYKKSLHWIVDGIESIDDKIPILGNTLTGPEVHDEQGDYPIEYIKMSSTGKQLYGLRVIGNSINVLYPEGDIVIVDSNSEPVLGEDAIIKFKTGEIMIQRLSRFDRDYIYLDSLNDNLKRIVRLKNEIEFINTIVGTVKSFMIMSN